MLWIWVALGGALGSILRFAAVSRFNPAASASFPVWTLGVNLAGSALIGILAAWLEASSLASSVTQQARALLLTGVLGGFTTFSAFSLENVALLRAGEWRLAALYVLASNVLGIGLALAGWWGTRLLLRPG